jgi:hypothetical protein
MLSISLVLSGIQGDCKVTAERIAVDKDRYKIEAGMPSFSLAFGSFVVRFVSLANPLMVSILRTVKKQFTF